jgi:hypothetical protein
MAVQHNKRKGYSRRHYDKRHKRYHRKKNVLKCPICHKSIHEYFTAITYKDSDSPAHFDCIIKEIKKQEELSSNEKICYLGNGSFGIITFRNPSSPIKFLIRKRIQYENKDEIPDWRKNLPVKLHRKKPVK